MNHFTRRQFLRAGAIGAAGAAATAASRTWPIAGAEPPTVRDPAGGLGPFGGYGPPQPDPAAVLDLPEGFRYRVLTATGDVLSGGARRPSLCDGMEVFDAGGGRLALCVNHEVRDPGRAQDAALRRPGDRDTSGGGTTTLVVDARGDVEEQFVSHSDSLANCAGGATPWGTWLTCEETTVAGYGYVYEVDPLSPDRGRRLPALGRCSHEAVAYDRADGVLYLTEDTPGGLCYRFLPQRRDDLGAGRLQALAVGAPQGRNERLPVRWVDLTDVAQSPTVDLSGEGRARGATPFRKLEGVAVVGASVYFDDSSGGDAGLGRIWRYRPRQERLELWYEAAPASGLHHPDNLRGQPGTGDLWACEDGSDPNRLVVQTTRGEVVPFAVDRTGSEVAGVSWDPTGRRLFVNLQQAGLTLTVEGPFRAALAGERGSVLRGTPPGMSVRRADPDVVGRARRDRGMSALEVEAAFALGHGAVL